MPAILTEEDPLLFRDGKPRRSSRASSFTWNAVGAGVLGASEGDEAEGEGRKWSVNVVVAAKKVEGKGGIRQRVECGATDT